MRQYTHDEAPSGRPAVPCRATCLAALAAALVVPAVLSAQEATPAVGDSARAAAAPARTHMVKKGDTLWDLANRYLGNPFGWPRIHEVNTDVVRDPHWIYPGEVLRIPGERPAAAASDMTATASPQNAPAQVSVGAAGPVGPTIFASGVEQRLSASTRLAPPAAEYPRSAVRPGEYHAAPWVDRKGGPAGQGRLVASADILGIGVSSGRTRLGPEERGYITLPSGVTAARGDRFVIFADGPQLGGGAQVMLPTGVVEVERVADGEATTVRLVQQFAHVEIGQKIMPLEHFEAPVGARPRPVTSGTETNVTLVPSRVVLPTVGYYVILGTTARDGVKPGDEFTLYRPRASAHVPGESRSVTLPEEQIAIVQVMKVTDRGTTAMIMDQRQPAIKEGVRARLTGRMP